MGNKEGGKGWGVGLLRRLSPPSRSGGTNAGHRSRCRDCGACYHPAGGCFGSRIRPLFPSCCQTLLNLMVPCSLRGWGPQHRRLPTPGFSGSSTKFKFPLARFFFLDPSAVPGLRGFLWGNDPVWEEVGRPGNEGVSSPSPLSGAAGVSTADSASVPQPPGGRLRGSGAAGTHRARRGQSPCCAVLPKRSLSLSTSCLPPVGTGAVTEAAC